MRFVRALGFFALGLGISVVLGRWLQQQDPERQPQPQPDPEPEPTHIVLSQKTLDEAEAMAEVDAAAEEPAAEIETAREEATAEATGVDDLTQIAGIGPKTAETLQEAGITTFAALAALSVEDALAKLEGVRGVNAEKVTDWLQQAAERSS